MSSYPGGKAGAGVYQQLINLMPPHEVYIEPFLGGGAVMKAKRAAMRNIGIDLDPQAIAGYPETGAELLVCDGLKFLTDYPFRGGELVYCDPPYLMSTRRSKRPIYHCEFTDDHHRQLLEILGQLPCRVMISGYWSRLYADRLKRWHGISYQAITRSGRRATEWVWCNFARPTELHDYSYLGEDFRQRERIKRKCQRWAARLLRLPALERRAILAAIADPAICGKLSDRTD